MKHYFFIPILFILLTGLACSVFTGSSTPSASQAQLTPSFTSPPPTDQSTPETASPTATQAEPGPAANTPAASGTKYTETFDKPNDAWTALQIVTSQAGEDQPPVLSKLENGRLRLSVQEKETYAYQFLKTPINGNVSIGATYEYRTLVNNGVALVCKADPGYKSWYEVRLLSPEGKYDIYQYDQQRKADNKNPYILLGTGLMKPKEFSTSQLNTVILTCTNNELKLDVNNGARVITQTVDSGLTGTLSGIGVMSYNLVPVNIDFKTVTLQSQ